MGHELFRLVRASALPCLVQPLCCLPHAAERSTVLRLSTTMRLTLLLALCVVVPGALAQEAWTCRDSAAVAASLFARDHALPELTAPVRSIPADTVAVGTTTTGGREWAVLQGTFEDGLLKFVRGQVIVNFRPPACPENLDPLIEALGLTVLRPFEPSRGSFTGFTSALLLVPPGRDYGGAVAALRASPAVWYAHPNYVGRFH